MEQSVRTLEKSMGDDCRIFLDDFLLLVGSAADSIQRRASEQPFRSALHSHSGGGVFLVWGVDLAATGHRGCFDRRRNLADFRLMNALLRSWKLCRVSRDPADANMWRKQRLKRCWLYIAPGNLVLRFLNAGYRVCNADWAEYECRIFRQVHPDLTAPQVINSRTIVLPHLDGVTLSQMQADELRVASVTAFAELGRFHRINSQMIHGDPHTGNFLYDATTQRCRILDFETAPLHTACARRSRAMDFAILLLDLVRREPLLLSQEMFAEWAKAYHLDDADCGIRGLLSTPDWRLRCYWFLLGYPAREVVSFFRKFPSDA